jgi:hypothetical protein
MTVSPELLEQSRAEGRREEAERINAIMNHSYRLMGCTCPECNAVALGLIYEPMRNGKFANAAQAKTMINASVRGGWGHA